MSIRNFSLFKHSLRFIGPYRNHKYGGSNNFYHKQLSKFDIDTSNRVRGQISFWHWQYSWGIITCDLTGDHFHFDHQQILAKNGFRELMIWRNVEFTPNRSTLYKYIATDIIDLGPSAYMPPTGVTESQKYPEIHLTYKNQWDNIPYFYHTTYKSGGPMNQMDRVKPLLYKDGKVDPYLKRY